MASKPFPLIVTQDLPQPQQFGPDLAVRLICPDCQDPVPNIIEEFSSGDLVCGSCGLVLGDRIIDTRCEWRTFIDDSGGNDPSRVGAVINPLFEGDEPEFETEISFRDGNSGAAKELRQAAARAHKLSRTSRDHLTAFRTISSWCDQFSLPKTISDIAKQLYRRIEEEKANTRAHHLDAICAACIFVACRMARVPRTFKEICNLTRVPYKAVGRAFRAIALVFDLNYGAPSSSPPPGASTTAEDLLVRYCNHLVLPSHVEPICRDIVTTAREHGIAPSRSPISIAAGAIYFACHLLGQPKSASQVSEVAGISDNTVRLAYTEFYADKEKLVKEEWLKDGRANLEWLPFVALKSK